MPLRYMPIVIGALLCLGTGLVIASGFVFYMMIGEVNRKLPENQQIRYMFTPLLQWLEKPGLVKQQYNRFYPNGRLYTAYIVLMAGGFAAGLVGAILLRLVLF
jgi:hypothetical protein